MGHSKPGLGEEAAGHPAGETVRQRAREPVGKTVVGVTVIPVSKCPTYPLAGVSKQQQVSPERVEVPVQGVSPRPAIEGVRLPLLQRVGPPKLGVML